jgi:hypothetical protein
MLHGRLLFADGHFRRVAIIEADKHHVVLATWVERKHAQAADHALLKLRAQHRAAVIHERQQHRLLMMQKTFQCDAFPVLVSERYRDRQLRVQLRPERHILQDRRHTG